jgi:hypothetical protein
MQTVEDILKDLDADGDKEITEQELIEGSKQKLFGEECPKHSIDEKTC